MVPAMFNTRSDVTLAGRLLAEQLGWDIQLPVCDDYHGKQRHHVSGRCLLCPADCRKSTHQNPRLHIATDQSSDLRRQLDGQTQATWDYERG